MNEDVEFKLYMRLRTGAQFVLLVPIEVVGKLYRQTAAIIHRETLRRQRGKSEDPLRVIENSPDRPRDPSDVREHGGGSTI